MSGDTEGWLRWVAARTEIVDLLHRYCAAVDDRDVSAVIACFAEDARLELEHGTLVADGHRGIREIFERAFADGLAGIGEVSTHATSGVVIDLRADRARVRSSTITVLIGGPRVIVRGVRLIDDVVLVEGGWCIAHRRHQPVWQWSPKTESAPEVLDPGRARPPSILWE